MREEATTDELLHQLLSKTAGTAERLVSPVENETPNQPASHTQPSSNRPATIRRRKTKTGHYEKVMHGIGVLGGMAGSIGLWWIGAFFTLRWIESLGLGVSTSNTVLWWLLPITITAMEVGLQPGNIKRNATSLIWGLVLLFDAYTTAIGLHWWANEQMGIAMPKLEYWTLAILGGVLLALSPERIGRLLWNEMR